MGIKLCRNFQGIRIYKNFLGYKYIIYLLFIQIKIWEEWKKYGRKTKRNGNVI